jgi:hypothetical protein
MMAARDPSETAATAAMASLDLSAAPEDDDQAIDIVSVNGYTFDQIIQHIIDAYRCGTESIISLHCPPEVAWDLSARLNEKLIALDQTKIQRFEYDYQSSIAYIDIMSETSLHFQFLSGTHGYTKVSLARFLTTIPDAALRQQIAQEILDFGTARIEKEDEILKQGDFAFGTVTNKLPSLVGEVS